MPAAIAFSLYIHFIRAEDRKEKKEKERIQSGKHKGENPDNKVDLTVFFTRLYFPLCLGHMIYPISFNTIACGYSLAQLNASSMNILAIGLLCTCHAGQRFLLCVRMNRIGKCMQWNRLELGNDEGVVATKKQLTTIGLPVICMRYGLTADTVNTIWSFTTFKMVCIQLKISKSDHKVSTYSYNH